VIGRGEAGAFLGSGRAAAAADDRGGGSSPHPRISDARLGRDLDVHTPSEAVA
jgi:hypothetical protein